MSQIFDMVDYPKDWDNFIQFNMNNNFYTLAPEYYYTFYATYLAKSLSLYDGYVEYIHSASRGVIPQKMLQSVSKGLNQVLFSNGMDFSCDNDNDYEFITKWAKKHRSSFFRAVMKARLFAFAGGTSLLKLDRIGGDLTCSAYRLDYFFVNTDPEGNIQEVKIYKDVIDDMMDSDTKAHYGLCERRYFNENHEPCVQMAVYMSTGILQTSISERKQNPKNVKWTSLPPKIKQYIKKTYPAVMLDEEQHLPFKDHLGCVLIKNTECIPQASSLPFGQPIADILATESIEYDQLKFFEKEEIHLARARALIPEEFWNKDDPANSEDTLDDRFYQQMNTEQITPIQFDLRSEKIKTMRETLLKDIAFKLNVSASTVASFLDDGSGAMTATQIISEKTKTDTWVRSQIALISPEINEILRLVCNYYGKGPCEIILKAEGQSPFLEKLKTFSDVYSAGNISPENFVNNVYANLSQADRQKEIDYLQQTRNDQREMQQATTNAWQQNQ